MFYSVGISTFGLVRGCRGGSTQTLWQTSDIRGAMKSRSSLCRIVGKPPVGQFMACSTVKLFEQAQVDDRPEGCHPYRKQIASLKAPL